MARREISEDAIRRRANEISERDDAGNEQENWERAERELRGEDDTGPWAKTSSGDADSITDS
jgi:hypothetical protein